MKSDIVLFLIEYIQRDLKYTEISDFLNEFTYSELKRPIKNIDQTIEIIDGDKISLNELHEIIEKNLDNLYDFNYIDTNKLLIFIFQTIPDNDKLFIIEQSQCEYKTNNTSLNCTYINSSKRYIKVISNASKITLKTIELLQTSLHYNINMIKSYLNNNTKHNYNHNYNHSHNHNYNYNHNHNNSSIVPLLSIVIIIIFIAYVVYKLF